MIIDTDNFEPYVMKNVKNDGSKILFTMGAQNIKNIVDIPMFRVEDIKLGNYLGMSTTNPISLISMTNNMTDFDTYIMTDVEVDTSGETFYDIKTFVDEVNNNKISPITWHQSNKTHGLLNMQLLNDIFRPDGGVHVTLFFSSVDKKTLKFAKEIIKTAKKFNVTYSCWDLMVSDPPVELGYKKFPSIGVTLPLVYGKYVSQLRYPIFNETIYTFVEANINEYKKIKQV